MCFEFPGGGSFARPKNLKEMYEALLEFPEGFGGGGGVRKNPLYGRHFECLSVHFCTRWPSWPPHQNSTGEASNYNPRWRHTFRKHGLTNVPFQNKTCTTCQVKGLYASLMTHLFCFCVDWEYSYSPRKSTMSDMTPT